MSLKLSRGDTLVEVLLATAILAFVITGTSYVMNRGLSDTQISLERTQIQAEIAGQAAILRALHAEAVASGAENTGARQAWEEVVAMAVSGSTTMQKAVCKQADLSNNRFYFDNRGGSPDSWVTPIEIDSATSPVPQNASGLPVVGDGLWVEAYELSGMSGHGAYDFYIKACWESSGVHTEQELRTVVRLYEIL